MFKKGAFEWETVAKFLIPLILLLILILLIGLYRDKMSDLAKNLMDIFRFGGS